MVVVGALVMISRLDERKEPVPVKETEVGIEIGRGMPAQQVVVMKADFTSGIVMANVVVVGLRQRNVNDAEDHDPDEEVSCPRSMIVPPRRHVRAPILSSQAEVAHAGNRRAVRRGAMADSAKSILIL